MKWTLFILIHLVVTTFIFCQAKPASQKNSSRNSNSFALLELFTSEGCSSCPSADRLLPELIETDSNVIALSFHVDYWDNLGWKDAFSNTSYTERQRQYAEQFHLESIYTPQLVINGQYELVGSNRPKAESFIKKAQQETATTQIKIISVKKEEQELAISCHLEGNMKNSKLLVTLVQKRVERKIGAGENKGATLVHTNVVRSFVEQDARNDMNFKIGIPAGINDGDWQLILYTQRKADLKITGVVSYG